MAYPVLAPSSTWYKSSVLRSTITKIDIVDSYTATGSETETWSADVDNSGSIICYLNGTVLTIAGNGSGGIELNSDSSYLFSSPIGTTSEAQHLFTSCTEIAGLELLDSSNVTDLSRAFAYCISLTELDLSSWDVSRVENFGQMFENCKATYINGLENWNTSSGKTFNEMFSGCQSLKELNLSSFDTSNANDSYIDPQRNAVVPGGMYNMFGQKFYNEDGTLNMGNYMARLEKITLGENFNFKGDGTCKPCYLPQQEPAYIPGADGCWYDMSSATAYTIYQLPSNTSATYCSSPELLDLSVSVTYGSLAKIANAVRRVTGAQDKYRPTKLSDAITSMEHHSNIEYMAKVLNREVAAIDNPYASGTIPGFFQKDNKNLLTVTFSNIAELRDTCFSGCSNLSRVYFPSVTLIDSNNFSYCHALAEIYFPSLETIKGWGWNFANCSSLKRAYFPKLKNFTSADLINCTRLTTLVLGADVVCTIPGSDVLDNTPISGNTVNTGGVRGYIYVPRSLVESYKTNENWSIYADQIRAIEDYPEVLSGYADSNHQELEYLQSDGRQYIDCCITGGQNASYEIKFAAVGSPVIGYEHYLANSKKSRIPPKLLCPGFVGAEYCDNDGTWTSEYLFSRDNEDPHIVRFASGDMYVDGELKNTYLNHTGDGWGNYPWYIFGCYAEPERMAVMRLYYLKMYTDGILVRDFIPVKRFDDDVLCLYDKVSCSYFENQGIGEFTTTNSLTKTYGVSWDYGSSPFMVRTDDAATFALPTPSIAGSDGSSPFDNLMPWAGMEVVEDDVLEGSYVSIPKFYYKWTKTDGKLQLQISPSEQEGFNVSPAHMDRGDGKGERDVVYIARYKCAGDYGYPVSGEFPISNITRNGVRMTAREIVNEISTVTDCVYSMQDYAMFWTTRMLMLVEYATWDLQSAIGYDCGDNSGPVVTGLTDSMPYHTGTIHESLDTYGTGVQYRHIEDPWGNVGEWCDGWRAEESSAADGSWDIYVFNNPAEFADESGGVLVGTIDATTANGGFIKNWTIPDTSGYEWALIPTANEDNIETGFEYVSDYCVCCGPSLVVGGRWDADPRYGPFLLSSSPASYAGTGIGARLQKLP